MITTPLALLVFLLPSLPQETPDPAAPGLTDARPAPAQGVEVTYLGGEGFLVRSRAKTILVDAFLAHDDSLPAIPDDVKKALIQREGIFEKVHVHIGTHRHGDQFLTDQAADFLRHQKGRPGMPTITDGPPAVTVPLRKALAGEFYASQVNDRWVKVGRENMLALPGLRVDYLNTPHAGDEGAKIQHLAVSTLHAGMRIVYFAHTEPKIEHFEPYQQRIANADIAVVPYTWILDDETLGLFRARVAPRHVVVTGVPEKEAAALAPRLEKAFPGVILPAQPMESHTLAPTAKEQRK